VVKIGDTFDAEPYDVLARSWDAHSAEEIMVLTNGHNALILATQHPESATARCLAVFRYDDERGLEPAWHRALSGFCARLDPQPYRPAKVRLRTDEDDEPARELRVVRALRLTPAELEQMPHGTVDAINLRAPALFGAVYMQGDTVAVAADEARVLLEQFPDYFSEPESGMARLIRDLKAGEDR
jgi:hypothetical protein